MTRPLLIIVFLFAVSLILPFSAIAQTSSSSGDYNCQDVTAEGCVSESVNNEDMDLQRATITAAAATDLRFICGGLAGLGGLDCTGFMPSMIPSGSGGVLRMLDQAVITMYKTPAADPALYIADIGNRMGLISPVYAQSSGIGIGFTGLSALLPIWSAFRNIAYAFLILIMVTIGFMIMLRHRLDPRTVVTVQNALPGVIVALILVTFSYAIAGLMIDLMYLVIGLAYVALGAADPTGELATITSNSFPGIIKRMFSMAWSSVDDVYGLFGPEFTVASVATGVGVGGVTWFLSVLAAPTIALGLVGAAALPLIIVFLAVLFAMLRVFFMLLSAYIQVLMSIIFGPLQIMLGAIPGNGGFGNWIRGLLANLSVFAVTAIMIALGILLGQKTGTNPTENGGNLWTPPGIAGNTADAIAGLLGLGVMLVIPSIAAGVKELFKTKPIAPISGSTFLSPISSLTGGIQQGVGMISQWRMITRH